MLHTTTFSKKIILFIFIFGSIKTSAAQSYYPPDSLSNAVYQKQQLLLKQNDYTISGKITDQNGNPITSASILALNNRLISYSDKDGNYLIKLKYTDITAYSNLSFDYEGKKKEIRNVHITDFPARVNVVLEPPQRCCIIEEQFCSGINYSWKLDKMLKRRKKFAKNQNYGANTAFNKERKILRQLSF